MYDYQAGYRVMKVMALAACLTLFALSLFDGIYFLFLIQDKGITTAHFISGWMAAVVIMYILLYFPPFADNKEGR